MKSLFILLTLVAFALSTNIEDPNSLIHQIVEKLTFDIPGIKNNLNANPQIHSDSIRPIVGRGFKTFIQNAEIALYNRVDNNGLTQFLEFLKGNVRVPDRYQSTFIDELSMIMFSDLNEIVESNIVFSVGNGGACKFICILGQNNADGTTSWLVADIHSEFTLAPNILLIESKKKKVFGLSSSSMKIIEEERTLTPEQKEVLFTFFEITAFERFAEVLKISQHLH